MERDAKFKIGEVVKHRFLSFRGVIFDVNGNALAFIESTGSNLAIYQEKAADRICTIIENLITKGVKVGGVTADEAVNNLKTIFKYEPHVVNSKLMQITWLDGLLSITDKEDRDKFCTDLIFLAEKAGRRYGPYAKLY